MGSRITKALYKNQRQKPITQHATRESVNLLSVVLYIIATIFVGYIYEIDLILQKELKELFNIHEDSWFYTVQNSLILIFICFISVACSVLSHRFMLIKCSVVCIVSQITLYFSIRTQSLYAMMVGEILSQISSIGLMICALIFIKKNFNYENSPFVYLGFFSAHELGIRISLQLVPQIYNNNRPAIYTISILFVVLQLFCVVLIFILQKTYLMPKQKRTIPNTNVFEQAYKIFQALNQYKKYTVLIMLTFLSQFFGNRMYKIEMIQASDTLYIIVACILMTVLSRIFKESKYLNIALVINVIFVSIVAYLYPSVGRTLLIVTVSGVNLWMLSRFTNVQHFSLLLGGVLMFTQKGKLLKTQNLVNILICGGLVILGVLLNHRLKRKQTLSY